MQPLHSLLRSIEGVSVTSEPNFFSVHDLFFELDHVGELTMDRFWSIELRPIRFEVS